MAEKSPRFLELETQEKALRSTISELQPAVSSNVPWDGLSLNNHRTKPYPSYVQAPDGQDYGRIVAEVQALQLLVADLRNRLKALEPQE